MRHYIYIFLFLTECVVVLVHGMAILKSGTPLRWDQAKQHLTYVRDHGVEQFLRLYTKTKHIKTPSFFWGDEIEVGIFKREISTGHFDLSCRGTEIRTELNSEPAIANKKNWCEFQPEYGAWMVCTFLIKVNDSYRIIA